MKSNETDHIYSIANQAFINLDCLFDSLEARVQNRRFKRQRYFCYLSLLECIDRATQIDGFPQDESPFEKFPAVAIVEIVDIRWGSISDLSTLDVIISPGLPPGFRGAVLSETRPIPK